MRASENPTRQSALARLRSFMPADALAASDRMNAIRSQLVNTARDDEAGDRLLRLKTSMFGPVDGKEGSILIITGESHAGKTTMLERKLLVDPGLQPDEIDDKPVTPLVYMCVKAPCSLQSLAVELLTTLGYPVKVDMKRPAAFKLLREKLQEREVLILWLDEAQNLLHVNNPLELTILANNLVTLVQNMEWPIRLLLSGLPELDDLVGFKQIRSRADHWPLGKTSNPVHVATWLHEIVEVHAKLKMDESLYAFDEEDQQFVDNKEFALRLVHAAGGNFGTIMRLIRDAVECAFDEYDLLIEKGDAPAICKIGRKHFAKAYANIVGVSNKANIFWAPNWGDLPGDMARVKLAELDAAAQATADPATAPGKKVKALRAGERRK